MRSNLLGSFAAGLLIATSISGAVFFATKSSNASKAPVKTKQSLTAIKVQPTKKEMQSELSSAGYVVQTKSDYDKAIAEAKSGSKSTPPANGQKIVYRVPVRITQGMTSIDVGNWLVRGHIITDAFKFSKDVENKGIENHLRPGTYIVDSSMSYDQVISAIFGS
ncbi:aminodeoxychorismate lyase [Heyndrickxia acidicola]|uniref:Aminodeoxychorismate lyase n=1 Tax=Heyndrickxia acidicola TaxID=209389 RepID=A0ABU6MAL6_9BACI|nr:aminodeoxychorismate lyase [Heyndrickxia acidicola]MED1201698.1 aminodeoxychorismate lyase [Heyndrickxia acidicola]